MLLFLCVCLYTKMYCIREYRGRIRPVHKLHIKREVGLKHFCNQGTAHREWCQKDPLYFGRLWTIYGRVTIYF